MYTVCHSFYIYWRHYFIVKLNGFILRTTTVAGLGVPILRVFTVSMISRQEITILLCIRAKTILLCQKFYVEKLHYDIKEIKIKVNSCQNPCVLIRANFEFSNKILVYSY